MSRISQYALGRNIIPGLPLGNVISTPDVEGNAAVLLKCMGKSTNGGRITRTFPANWETDEGILAIEGSVHFKGDRPLILKIGMEEGLVVRNIKGKRWSWKANNGKIEIEVGDELFPEQLNSYAHQVVANWVVHGTYWKDRAGTTFKQPYGAERGRITFERFFFNIVDGAKKDPRHTFGDLMSLGCKRSTHVGNWAGRHSTLIAAISGMPLTLHEFKEEGEDVCVFDTHRISHDSKIWSGYSRWDEQLRRSGELGVWKELALESASPFAFHVHATRMLFPKAQLTSDFLLGELKQDRLAAALEIMVTEEPDRFYRLIDEDGVTHRYRATSGEYLFYGQNERISRRAVVENVLNTFNEMQRVQSHCWYSLRRCSRVVMDTHSYMVLESIAEQRKNVYALSGRQMHQYLTEPDSAHMHRIRNERLFSLVKELFNVEAINFHIYPPMDLNPRVTSQYGNLELCDKRGWLSYQV